MEKEKQSERELKALKLKERISLEQSRLSDAKNAAIMISGKYAL